MLDVRHCILYITVKVLNFILLPLLSLYYRGKKKVVPPITNELLLKSAKQLAYEIRTRKLKCEQVVQAYIDRIQEVEPFINATVRILSQEALIEAREVDKVIESKEFTEQELEEKKPLLGVPISIKLLLAIKGLENNVACKLYEGTIATEDAKSVAALKNAGGIILAVTNVPECGLAYETYNLLYGRTCNPYDTTKTSGGSSGGESALLAAGGSVIGLGNDIAGSLRIPAHFTGIFSHKATRGVIPSSGGYIREHPGLDPFIYTGPMCRYAEDVMLLTQIMAKSIDKPLKDPDQINFRNLKIYFMINFGDPLTIPVDAEITSRIMDSISYFVNMYGASATEVKIPYLNESCYASVHCIQAPCENIVEFLFSGKITHLKPLSEIFKFITRKETHSMYLLHFLFCSRCPMIFQRNKIKYYQNLCQQVAEEFDKILDDNSVFFCPTFPVTAPHHSGTLSLITNSCYTSIFNIIGLPATNCPIGLHKNGMPISVQIIGKENNDVLTLACANELEKAFGGWIPPKTRKYANLI